MSTLPPATEVAMDLDSSSLMIRLRGPTTKTTRDTDMGTLKLELLDRVEGILEKIGKALSRNFDKLPAKVQQLGASGRPGDLLQRLNVIVRDHVLDDFFREHDVCRRHFSQLFGCRYPYLREPDSGVDDEATGRATAPSVPVEGLQAALDERLQSRPLTTGGVSWQPVVNENDDVENAVTLKKGAHSANPASNDAVSECIDAFNGFVPLYNDSSNSLTPTWSITLQELEIAEKLYRHMDTLLSKESVGNLLQGMPNMGPQLKEAFAQRFANLSDISQRFQGEFQNKIFAEMPAKSGIELEMTIGPDDSTEADQDNTESLNIVEAGPVTDTNQRPRAVVTSSDAPLQKYKGWLIKDPRIQLARAKNFLADGDIDRTPGWQRKFAELAEYFAYLQSKFRGESWIHDLREALDMLRAHWIFETYYYGEPQLVVDFATGFWPKRSTRLPQLPGPEIELRPRDRVTGPAKESDDASSTHDDASERVSSLAHPSAGKKPDAGIVYAMKMLAHPPEKESRDPWAYTRAYQFFKQEELRWAQWTREHAIKESYAHKLWMSSDEPVMELPRNYKGPVQPDLMNLEMKKTYELLRRCQKIHQGLKRAAKRAPRGFIIDLLTAVNKGMAGSPTHKTKLRFGEHEFDADGDTLANVRPTEAAWLEYICQPSRNRPQTLKEALGKKGELLLSRVTQMMRDISPISLFGDMKPRTMEHFLQELNAGCRGPVRRHEFTEREVKQLAPKLHDLKVLKNLTSGELMFGRPETEFHPEDLVKWPDAEPQSWPLEKKSLTSYTSQTRPKSKGKEKMRDDASVVSHDTISTKVSVPASSEDFHMYPPDMPQRQDVLSLRKFIKDPVRSPARREKTANFFFCLGYRLGKTLVALQKQHADDEKKLQDPDVQERNSSFLDTILQYWEDDAKKRPSDRTKNKANTRAWRITMLWTDVVKIADPDVFEQHREQWAEREYPDQGIAYDLVRRSLLREAAENKTMLWPLRLPYNSYVTRYKVADPTPWKDRFQDESDEIWRTADWDTRGARIEALQVRLRKEQAEDEKKQDELAAQAQNLTTMRREPVWTFAHPSRKKAAHLFWDINNWPVHLQSESRQRVIASRGPDRANAAAEDDGGSSVAALAEELGLEQDAEMPYWKVAERKRRFVPGREEFWMGDTPLQRRVFEERMKMRLAPPARKRTWGDVLKEAVFGSPSTKPTAGGVSHHFELPPVPEHLIPESRSAKRQRTEGPLRKLGEEQKPDLFAIARGETGMPAKPAVPVQYQGTYSKAGQIMYRIPDPKIQRKGGVGSLMEGDGPAIEYMVPVKRD
ncbi:hypothetical protein CCMA1212_005062 [Trichoderma ghanense]|uniref:Uncharacterized protein n=1 Tax=Trichoderma ghanense TaxID=65468 RepID=A0ABY2H324_9HYPO